MDRKGSTYWKALLLVLVFCMNTVISFACSLSGFVHGMHHHPGGNAPHVHTAAVNEYHHEGQQEHGIHQEDTTGSDEQSSGDCCSSSVVSLEKVDKSTARGIDVPGAVFFTATANKFFEVQQLDARDIIVAHPERLRWRILATIPDPRIAMQSFQI